MLKRYGCMLVMLGVGSFILPFLGMQFRLFTLFGGAQPIIAVLVMAAGVILLAAGFIRSSLSSRATTQQVIPVALPAGQPQPPATAPRQFVSMQATAQARRCVRCGEALEPTDSFCGECGSSVSAATPAARQCPNPLCGRTVAANKRFCGSCGTPVP